MNKKIVIIGASGHGKVVANIAKLNDYNEILFLDDDVNKKECSHYKVVGSSKQIDLLIKNDYDFVVAIGNNKTRMKIYESLADKKAKLSTLIHPTAVIDETVNIGNGTVVMANVTINSSTNIGSACIINTAATIDHDCNIRDYVHVSPGVHIAGNVSIGERTWIGIGANVINNLDICSDCIIGAGSVVIKDILECGTYIGSLVKRISR